MPVCPRVASPMRCSRKKTSSSYGHPLTASRRRASCYARHSPPLAGASPMPWYMSADWGIMSSASTAMRWATRHLPPCGANTTRPFITMSMMSPHCSFRATMPSMCCWAMVFSTCNDSTATASCRPVLAHRSSCCAWTSTTATAAARPSSAAKGGNMPSAPSPSTASTAANHMMPVWNSLKPHCPPLMTATGCRPWWLKVPRAHSSHRRHLP